MPLYSSRQQIILIGALVGLLIPAFVMSPVAVAQRASEEGATTSSSVSTRQRQASDAFFAGLIQMELQKYREAIVSFDYSLQLVPNHVLVLYHRAACKLLVKDYSGTIEDTTKVINFPSELSEGTHALRAYARFGLNDYTGTIEDATIALNDKDSKNHAYLYQYRGMAKSLIEDFSGATADLEQAKSLFLSANQITEYKDTLEILKNLNDIAKTKEDFSLPQPLRPSATIIKITPTQAPSGYHCNTSSVSGSSFSNCFPTP